MEDLHTIHNINFATFISTTKHCRRHSATKSFSTIVTVIKSIETEIFIAPIGETRNGLSIFIEKIL
jgi:hypothetical protein